MTDSQARLSDDKLSNDIKQRFADERERSPRFDPDRADIAVSVNDGHVTLEGWVNDAGTQEAAVALATATPGVLSVTNQLSVKHGEPSSNVASDTGIGYQGRSRVADPKAGDDDKNLIGEPRI